MLGSERPPRRPACGCRAEQSPPAPDSSPKHLLSVLRGEPGADQPRRAQAGPKGPIPGPLNSTETHLYSRPEDLTPGRRGAETTDEEFSRPDGELSRRGNRSDSPATPFLGFFPRGRAPTRALPAVTASTTRSEYRSRAGFDRLSGFGSAAAGPLPAPSTGRLRVTHPPPTWIPAGAGGGRSPRAVDRPAPLRATSSSSRSSRVSGRSRSPWRCGGGTWRVVRTDRSPGNPTARLVRISFRAGRSPTGRTREDEDMTRLSRRTIPQGGSGTDEADAAGPGQTVNR